jgi:hypothetical protein
MGKPRIVGGLGWGDGRVAVVLTIVIFCLVAFLAITRADVQRAPVVARGGAEEGLPVAKPSSEGAD